MCCQLGTCWLDATQAQPVILAIAQGLVRLTSERQLGITSSTRGLTVNFPESQSENLSNIVLRSLFCLHCWNAEDREDAYELFTRLRHALMASQ